MILAGFVATVQQDDHIVVYEELFNEIPVASFGRAGMVPALRRERPNGCTGIGRTHDRFSAL
jgi:hypothetical protein